MNAEGPRRFTEAELATCTCPRHTLAAVLGGDDVLGFADDCPLHALPDTLPAPASDLHVFHDDDGEWIVARDAEDAWAVWLETASGTRADYPELEWTQLPDDQPLSLWADPDGGVAEVGEKGAALRSRPCSEWAKQQGRGYLATSNG